MLSRIARVNRIGLTRPVASTALGARAFHRTAPAFVHIGDTIPSVPVHDGNPSTTLDLAEHTASGKHIIVGVPGAYSPACSGSHIPGYVKAYQEFVKKGYGNVFVVTVNDPFVTSAWSKDLGADQTPGVKILADSTGDFTEALDLTFDAAKFFGNNRSKRYALIVKDGKVVDQFIEPDSVGISVSAADEVLKRA